MGYGYRIEGTTDDVTTCEQCGRDDLRATVVLTALGPDGGDEGQLYVGSECATRFPAPGGKRRTAYRVRQEAAKGDREAEGWRNVARDMLAFYDRPELTPRDRAKLYIRNSPNVADRIAERRKTDPDFTSRDLIAERIAEWREMLITGKPA